MTKYKFEIAQETLSSNINYLTNQLWKILPMREKGEDWQTQLRTVIVEISGLNKLLDNQDAFLSLLSKLEGLLDTNIDFILYRKIVFECISQLRGLFTNE